MADNHHVRIRPSLGFEWPEFGECFKFRGLLAALALRDVKLRYRQTALGIGWVIVQPLLASGILAFVFGTIAGVTKSGRSSVFVFVLGGFIGWTLFSATLTRASQSLLQHAALISKVYFPRLVLPVSGVVSGLLDAGVGLVLFVVLRLITGPAFGWEIVTLPVWLAALVIFALGSGLISGALSVRFRDAQYIVPVLIQLLFYASPIAYRTEAVPEKWRGLFSLNPLAPLFEGLRWSLLGEGDIRPSGMLYGLTVAALMLGAGLFLFQRVEREFADLI
jgi:lipopolysaccharide transport system permease protein